MATPKTLPNNPRKAYMMGKSRGVRDTLNMACMALIDKAGWHLHAESPDDRQSVEWLCNQLEKYAGEINSGHLRMKDVREMLNEEAGVEFVE